MLEDIETGEPTSTSKKKDLHHPDLKKMLVVSEYINKERTKDKVS